MIILGMVAYYVFAIGLVAAVLFLTVRRAKRQMDARHERLVQNIQRQRDATPPLPPPLPPFEFDGAVDDEDEDDEEADDEEIPDLSAPALQPIAPLLLRAAKEYLDKPNDRERLLRSLSAALGEPQPTP